MSHAAPDANSTNFTATRRLSDWLSRPPRRLTVSSLNEVRCVAALRFWSARDHFTLIRDSYRKLANELITQLQLVDKLDSEVAPSGPAALHWLRGEQQSSDI